MRCYDLILKTKRGIPLTEEEIRWMIQSYCNGDLPEAQISAWLMAVCFQSLTEAETAALTMAMRDSGDCLDLSSLGGITADKHSTGGVGDKTSLIIAPIAAACGVWMPKMSGRGLGHTGGTIDKLESVGCKTDLEFSRFLEITREAGFSIASQTAKLVPADKLLYALRDLTATVDSIPLICSSIMSKKLATGADCILLDVKCGSGAFMKTPEDAKRLAALMVQTGQAAGKRCAAVVSDMNAPLGHAIGNALEVQEAIQILQGEQGRLYELCILLAAQILCLAGKGNFSSCQQQAEQAVSTGAALERLERMLHLQGASCRTPMPKARCQRVYFAKSSGVLKSMASEEIGLAACRLGAGRTKKGEAIDPAAGILLHHTLGESVQAGEPLMTLFASSERKLDDAEAGLDQAIQIGDRFQKQPLILEVIGDDFS